MTSVHHFIKFGSGSTFVRLATIATALARSFKIFHIYFCFILKTYALKRMFYLYVSTLLNKSQAFNE